MRRKNIALKILFFIFLFIFFYLIEISSLALFKLLICKIDPYCTMKFGRILSSRFLELFLSFLIILFPFIGAVVISFSLFRSKK